MMTTNQPKWRCVANLGDVNALDYGGLFVFTDETGVYPPEMELIEPIEDEDTGRTKWEVRRAVLENCTYIDGILSDNQFHPDKPAWFADDIERIANCIGEDVQALIAEFCSTDPIARANAWRAVADYHGWDNLDSYPMEITSKREASRRIPKQYR